MSIYDNWEKQVAEVMKREEIWQLCHQQSRSPSICSESSDFSSCSRVRLVRGDETPDNGAAAVPRFGQWNENDPLPAEYFTHIFNKVREKRNRGTGNVMGTPKHPPLREGSHNRRTTPTTQTRKTESGIEFSDWEDDK